MAPITFTPAVYELLKGQKIEWTLFHQLAPSPLKDVLNIQPPERPLKSQMASEFQEGR